MAVATGASLRSTAAAGELLRVLGLGFGVAVVLGGMVGQGILRTPGIVAGYLHQPGTIMAAWALVGLFSLIDAFALVELGSAIPRAGGPFVFADRAFGGDAAAIVGWSDWLNLTFTIAFLAVVFAEYTQRLGLASPPIGAMAIAVIAVCSVLNCLGTRACGWSQNIGSGLKALVLLLIVGLCFAAPPAKAGPPVIGSGAVSLAGAAIALRAILSTYAGWNSCAYFCEEVRAPEKNVARSTFLGIAIVTGLYLLVNAGLLHVLTPGQIAASNLPLADAVGAAWGPLGAAAVTAFAMISVAAIANLTVMQTPRIVFGMARSGALPGALARIDRGGTPIVALVATSAVAAALASTGAYVPLMAIGATIAILVNLSVDLSVIVLRVREPGLHRPYRLPLFPAPPIAGIVINLAILAALLREDPANTLIALLAPAAGWAAYAGLRRLAGPAA